MKKTLKLYAVLTEHGLEAFYGGDGNRFPIFETRAEALVFTRHNRYHSKLVVPITLTYFTPSKPLKTKPKQK